MQDIALPQHVIAKLERRWARHLQQDAQAWAGERQARQFADLVRDGGRPIPVEVKRSRRPALATWRNCSRRHRSAMEVYEKFKDRDRAELAGPARIITFPKHLSPALIQ
jgi:predicted dehydrogenase